MKTKLLVMLTLGYAYTIGAQTIEKYSIDSGGETASVGAIQVLYTIGEVNVREITVGTLAVSEGFINRVGSNNSKATVEETAQSLAANLLNIETFKDDIKVYPNPASEHIYIASTIKLDRFKLYNAESKLIIQTKEDRIDVKSLNAGVYMLEIYTNEGKRIKKTVIVQ